VQGFGNRTFNRQGSVAIQHELTPGLALNLGYFRTSYGNFQVTDNQAVTAADFAPFSITVPVDARLPGGGGNVLTGLYDVSVAKFGQSQNLVTQSTHYGKQIEIYNGVDLTVSARLAHGTLLTGGMSSGRTETNNCFVEGNPQLAFAASAAGIVAPRTDAFCRVIPPWSANTQMKLSGSYTLPWDLRTSVTYQNLPGIPIVATFVANNAAISPSLGRNLSAGANATAIIDLIAPNTMFEGRISQVDLRVGKAFTVGRAKVQANIDAYNALNASPILTENARYGSAWKTPSEILAGRLIKFGVQMNF
jgi:hypothetical protein